MSVLRVVVALAAVVCAVSAAAVETAVATQTEAQTQASEAAALHALESLAVADHISGLQQQLQLTEGDAEAFGVLQELTAETDVAVGEPADVSAILESVHANIANEQARAARRFAQRKAAFARKSRRTRRVLRNLKRSAVTDSRRFASVQRRLRANEKRLKRTRSQLALAVQRHLAARNDVDKAVARKMTRIRALNNHILDAQTRVRALKTIAGAVLEAHPPQTPPRVFLQQTLHKRVADGELNPVFLQITDESETESNSEAEDVDEGEAVSDEEAAAELTATAEAIAANDDEADASANEEEMQEIEDEAAAAQDEAIDTAAEVDSDAGALEAAGQARMLQVLQTLSSTLPGDGSVPELVALLNQLITSGRAQLRELMAARKAALADFRVRTTELRKVAIRARLRVERLRRRVHRLERRTRRLVRRAKQLVKNLKENGVQTTLYERRLVTLRANFEHFKAQYTAASARRALHLKSLRKLQRRLEALAASRGGAPLTVDSSVIAGTYRWEASAWKKCSDECTEITPRALTAKRDGDVAPHTQPPTDSAELKRKRRVTTRKLKCFDFAHKQVDASNCKGLKQPRRTKRCPLKPCPRDCVVSSWHWPKECSNSCGTGTRIAHRNILQPERFGGSCPQRGGLKGGLRKAKQCFAIKGCTSVKAKRRAFRELRKRNAEQKANGTLPPKDPRHLPQPGDDQTPVWRPWLKRVAGAKKGKGKGKRASRSRRSRRVRRQRRQQQQARANVAGTAPVKMVTRLPKRTTGASKRERRLRRQRAAAKAKAKAKARARREKRRRQRAARRRAAKCRTQRRALKKRLAKLNRQREAQGLPALKMPSPGSAKAPTQNKSAPQPKPQPKAKAKLTKRQRKQRAIRRAKQQERRERQRLERKLKAAQRADAAANPLPPAAVTQQRTEAERAAIRAKVARCGKCRGGDKGKKCRAKHCAGLTRFQRLKAAAVRCKRCRAGKDGRKCRRALKCKERLAKLAAAKKRRAARKAAAAPAAPAAAANGNAAAALPLPPTAAKSGAKARAVARAKVARCGKCRSGDKGKKCRAKHCAGLTRFQRLQAVAVRCKRCRSGKSGRKCRRALKCTERLAKLKAAKKRRAARKAAAAAAANAAVGLPLPPTAGNRKARRAALNAKIARCGKCRGGDKGRKCRAKHCTGLTHFQRLRAVAIRCKRCRSGKSGLKCRRALMCRARMEELKELKAARKADKQAKAAAAAAAIGAPLPPAAAAATKKSAPKWDVKPSAIPSPQSPRQRRAAFWYQPSGAHVTAEGAVTRWRDSTEFGRDLTSVGGADPEVAPSRRPGKRAIRMSHTGMQSRRLRLGEQFDVIAVLRFDGNPKSPANRWGAASAFTVNAPKKTPADPFAHGTSGGVGVAVTDGQFRIVAEGKQWSPNGVDLERGVKYVVRLRRVSATEFELFVGPPSASGPILPSARLSTDIIEDDTARLKIGVSDALYYGWEGAVFEVIGFNGLISDAHVRRNYERLAKTYDLL